MKRILKNMKIRTQLIASFLFVAAITLGILIIALYDMNNSVIATEGLYNRVLMPLDYVSKSTIMMEGVKTSGRSSLLAKDPKMRDEAVREIISNVTKVKEYMSAFGVTIIKEAARIPYDTLMASLDEYLGIIAPFRILLQDDLTQDANLERALNYIDNTLSPISTTCLECLTNLNTIRLGLGEELMTSAVEETRIAFVSMIGLSAMGLLFTIIWGIYFSICLSKPILKGVEVMVKAAEGDFSVSLPQDYGAEIGQLYGAFNSLLEYNKMNIVTISETSAAMRESAQNMLSISSHMADNSKGLNEQTSLASSAVEEFSAGMEQSSKALSAASRHITAVASSIEEINSAINNVATAAKQTSARVEQSNMLVNNINNGISMASGSANLVSNAFNSVADSVSEISKSIIVINDHCSAAMLRVSNADSKAQSTNLIIRQLESASKQIGKIINIISDIAAQTNMLALNAAIEAAGAGEAGKGFMVVANEVKELARQTAGATDEIADKIENMQKNMLEAVDAVSEITEIINSLAGFMESLSKEVTQQGKRSDQIANESVSAAQRMNEITTEIGRISENALSVTQAVTDSTKSVNEIAKSTADLVVGSKEIAMNSEHASSNISEIDRSTKEMSTGIVEIAKNIQLIHKEAGSVSKSADQTNRSSEELLSAANGIEKFTSKFKMN